MPRRCTVCGHPQREAIDAALVAGSAIAALSREYGVSDDALGRHAAAHLPAALVNAREAAEVAHADDLLERARNLEAKALGILAKAEEAGDLRTAVIANREARGCLELLARMLGELTAAGVAVGVALNETVVRVVYADADPEERP